MTPTGYPIFSPEYYMNEALKEAQKAFGRDEVPVGAVVVCNRTIIARAHNLTETLNDATAHAEMQAFTAAAAYLGGKYLDECTLFVTLEPCVMCAGAAFWTQLGGIIYGAPDEKRGYMRAGNQLLHPKTQVASGVLAGECSQLLKLFFNNKRL
jgi:tRNA(adenine34) deaminase